MAPDPSHGLGSSQRGQDEPVDGLDTASAIVTGMVLGLGLWLAMIAICLLIAWAL